MVSTEIFSFCLFFFVKIAVGDEYPPYATRYYSPPATSYGVPVQAVEAPIKVHHDSPIVTKFTYAIPAEVPHQEPKPIRPVYGVPIAPAKQPIFYDIPVTKPQKPIISHVYGVPIVPKPKPVQDVYVAPTTEAPKPADPLPVYGLPVAVPKPKPIKVVYRVPVEDPTPKPIHHVYGVPNTEAPKQADPVPEIYREYGVPREIPILYAPYP